MYKRDGAGIFGHRAQATNPAVKAPRCEPNHCRLRRASSRQPSDPPVHPIGRPRGGAGRLRASTCGGSCHPRGVSGPVVPRRSLAIRAPNRSARGAHSATLAMWDVAGGQPNVGFAQHISHPELEWNRISSDLTPIQFFLRSKSKVTASLAAPVVLYQP
jgi:hypothetical protein